MSSNFFKLKTLIGRKIFGYFLEIYTYARLAVSSKNYPEKRFIIFSSGRSGSTLLVSLLNSNPNIFCDGEILNRRVYSQLRVIHAREKMSLKKVYGFKFLTYQLQFTQKINDPKKFLQDLYDDGFKIIYLLRKNILRQALSIMYAEYRNKWHHKSSSSNKGKIQKMNVNAEELVEVIEKLELSGKDEAEYLMDIPHIKISYEDHLEDSKDHVQTMKLLSEFLDEDYYDPSTNLQKISSSNLSSTIKNYDELSEFLRNSRFKEYLL